MQRQPYIDAHSGSPAIHDCWNRIGVRGDGSCAELEKHVHCRNCPTYSAAAARLLDRELPAGYRSEWTEHFARVAQEVELDTHSVLVFRIGLEWLALPVGNFLAVSELKPIHSLPHRRSRVVRGLVNFRGELLVCISLEEALALERTPGNEVNSRLSVHQRLLVVSRDGGRLAFPVEEVHGIHHYHLREVQAVPATVAKAAATYTKGILAWRERSVGILDDELLFDTLNRSLA